MMRLTLIALGSAAVAATPAHAQRVQVSPYIELGQVLTVDLNDGDTLTYSSIAAGVDASVSTRRVTVSASAEYERRIAWNDDLADSDVLSGIVRGTALVAPGLSIEGGALATRTRADIRGDAPGLLRGNAANVSQLYSAYVGPSYARRFGDLDVKASYGLGYVKVEVPDVPAFLPGQQPLDFYDDATSHLATASVGTRAGTYAPFGMTLSGAISREYAGQLDQRYEGQFLRFDIVQPLTPELAAVAGVGYERIEISQRDALVDGVGNIVRDENGRFVTDPDSPRRSAFETDGVFWDAGLLWRPSPRTTIEARVGRRYDSWTYIGSASHQTGPGAGVQIGVYDAVQTYGRSLLNGLRQVPVEFDGSSGDPFSDNFNGCVISTGSTGVGGCLNGVLQAATTSSFRARGADAVYAISYGPTRLGVGAGYTNRSFYAPDNIPGIVVTGLDDEAFYAQAFGSHQIDRVSAVNGTLFLNRYSSSLPLSPDVWNWGAQGSYNRSFGRLRAQASAGIYGSEIDDIANDASFQAFLGLGYRF